MMAAVLAPPLPTISLHNVDASLMESTSSPADARKRRREILYSQRLGMPLGDMSSPPNTESLLPVTKRRKVVSDESSVGSSSSGGSLTEATKTKRPQRKYDPEMPMSKQDAVVWRREQRRQRNRESAAASRQRQRDRIEQLESEISEWKVKYEAILSRIHAMEGQKGPSDALQVADGTHPESPDGEPLLAATTLTSPVLSQLTDMDAVPLSVDLLEQDLEELLPSKMTSRPAVKITDGTLPLFQSSDMGDMNLVPNLCLSAAGDLVEPELDDDVVAAVLGPDDSCLDELLFDTVDWL